MSATPEGFVFIRSNRPSTRPRRDSSATGRRAPDEHCTKRYAAALAAGEWPAIQTIERLSLPRWALKFSPETCHDRRSTPPPKPIGVIATWRCESYGRPRL
jgi:hypothetical protein